MSKDPTDMKTYKEINDNLTEQQKESLMTASLGSVKDSIGAIDVDTTGIYESVDQLESMIAGDGTEAGIHGRLDTIIHNQGLLLSAIDDAKTAIVNAIDNH